MPRSRLLHLICLALLCLSACQTDSALLSPRTLTDAEITDEMEAVLDRMRAV